jgi:hypothetical protein
MMAGNPSLVENCRAGASPAWATGAVALQFYDVGRFPESGRGAALVAIMAESKAHKRPNLPCAWYFALYRASGCLISLQLTARVCPATRKSKRSRIAQGI